MYGIAIVFILEVLKKNGIAIVFILEVLKKSG
jgi:hypothetical protein